MCTHAAFMHWNINASGPGVVVNRPGIHIENQSSNPGKREEN